MSARRKKIALWFRYGPAEHAELWHALPRLVERLSEHCEVHHFGMRSDKPLPALIADHSTVHFLPFKVNRKSLCDKTTKTLLWYVSLPYVALRCRLMGVDAVYIDETLPLTTFIARLFYGKNIAAAVVDFFVDIYFERIRLLAPVRHVVKSVDFVSWRGLPVLFTKTEKARTFLSGKRIPKGHVHVVHDPCDPALYHPVDKTAARRHFSLPEQRLIIVHHGILHPNKGNDRILRALAGLKPQLPQLLYLLVGTGPDEGSLKSLVTDLNLQAHVVFTGWLPRPKDVNLALNAADIGLVMRIGQESDDFHVTGALVHNMACGLPVLAARLAGIEEIVKEGEHGLLFDPGNMDEFKTQCRKLADSPELRDRLGRAALDLSRELFDIDRVTEQIVSPLLAMMDSEEKT